MAHEQPASGIHKRYLRAKLQAHIHNLVILDAQLLVALDDISQQILLRLHLDLYHKAHDTSMHIQDTLLLLMKASC